MPTVSGSFTDVSASDQIIISRSRMLHIELSGDFVATIQIEKRIGTGAWAVVKTFTQAADQQWPGIDGTFRIKCAAFTSGQADYVLTEASTEVVQNPFDQRLNEDDPVVHSKLTITDDASTVILDGSSLYCIKSTNIEHNKTWALYNDGVQMGAGSLNVGMNFGIFTEDGWNQLQCFAGGRSGATNSGSSFEDNGVDTWQVHGSQVASRESKAAGFNDTSITVDSTDGLTSCTFSGDGKRNLYLTGTAGASLVIDLAEAEESDNGAKYQIMSTVDRPSVTWVTGDSTVGLPTSLSANVPVTIQYSFSNTTWYIAG